MMMHPTKARILEAALALLGRAGAEGFSASALAREAGVSKATLFHHFGTLDEVPLAAFESLWSSRMTAPHLEGLGMRAYMEALGEAVIEVAGKERAFLNAYFVFVTRALFDERMRARLSVGMDELHRSMRAALAARLPSSVSAPLLDTLTRLLGVGLDGLGLHLLLTSDEAELRKTWRMFVELIAQIEEA
jgi:AcrR family transcriptional regulator